MACGSSRRVKPFFEVILEITSSENTENDGPLGMITEPKGKLIIVMEVELGVEVSIALHMSALCILSSVEEESKHRCPLRLMKGCGVVLDRQRKGRGGGGKGFCRGGGEDPTDPAS